MRRLSETAPLLITGVLALLLLAYVFAKPGAAPPDSKPHCTTRQSMDLVKHELFRRASGLRGANQAAMAQVSNYSVLRSASRMLRRYDRGSDKVSCSGTIVLDLPPGVAVIGGRSSLTSNVSFELAGRSNGPERLAMLSKADAIVLPLATISQAGSQPSQPDFPIPATQAEEQPGSAIERTAAPDSQPSRTAPVRKPQPPQPAAQASAPAAPVTPAPAPIAPREAEKRPVQARPAAPRTSVATNPGSGPAYNPRPSFNCRYARTRGEIAVCNDPGLAALDRQMATQFYSARSVARRGQRAMLERTRQRFLRYRDSCRSESCIADAYRRRMQEISGIMEGPW